MKRILLILFSLNSTLSFATPYLPTLRPVTYSEAKRLFNKVNATVLRVKNANSRQKISFGIPWAFAVGNHCSDRALISYLGLTTEQESADFTLPLSLSFVSQIIDHPSIEVAHISLFAPMKIKQKIYFSTTRSKEYTLNWKNHEALTINVDGDLRVVDLTASDIPIPITDWVQMYVKQSDLMSCSHLEDEEYWKIFHYDICLHNGWIPNPNGDPQDCERIKPVKLCGYRFTDDLGFDKGIRDDSWGGLIYNVNSAAEAFQNDLTDLRRDAGNALDPVKEIPYLKSTLIPAQKTWEE